jgi:hypothetical protein
MLLTIEGVELVAPPTADPDIPALVKTGSLMSGPVRLKVMTRSACHLNVARLWRRARRTLTGIGTGYVLSLDGLWRQHSWGMRGESIIETTVERLKYFGLLLQGTDADEFAALNAPR